MRSHFQKNTSLSPFIEKPSVSVDVDLIEHPGADGYVLSLSVSQGSDLSRVKDEICARPVIHNDSLRALYLRDANVSRVIKDASNLYLRTKMLENEKKRSSPEVPLFMIFASLFPLAMWQNLTGSSPTLTPEGVFNLSSVGTVVGVLAWTSVLLVNDRDNPRSTDLSATMTGVMGATCAASFLSMTYGPRMLAGAAAATFGCGLVQLAASLVTTRRIPKLLKDAKRDYGAYYAGPVREALDRNKDHLRINRSRPETQRCPYA